MECRSPVRTSTHIFGIELDHPPPKESIMLANGLSSDFALATEPPAPRLGRYRDPFLATMSPEERRRFMSLRGTYRSHTARRLIQFVRENPGQPLPKVSKPPQTHIPEQTSRWLVGIGGDGRVRLVIDERTYELSAEEVSSLQRALKRMSR
jgi:hypothetical protein